MYTKMESANRPFICETFWYFCYFGQFHDIFPSISAYKSSNLSPGYERYRSCFFLQCLLHSCTQNALTGFNSNNIHKQQTEKERNATRFLWYIYIFFVHSYFESFGNHSKVHLHLQTKFGYTLSAAFVLSFTVNNQISLSLDIYFGNDLFVVWKAFCTHQTSDIFKCGCFCNAYPLLPFFHFDLECWSNHF